MEALMGSLPGIWQEPVACERVRERRALWQGFVQSAGLTAHWVEEEQ